MRRILRCLVLIVAALTLDDTARADLTAVYRSPDNPYQILTLEISDNGDVRSEQGGQYDLAAGAGAYHVTAGPGGPIVVRTADLAAVQHDAAPPRRAPPVLRARGSAVVNGRTGIAYAPDDEPADTSLVISADPALAPIGRALRRSWFGDGDAPPSPPGSTAALLENGAPLRLSGMELTTVSRAPIPAERLRVPATPLSLEQVRERFGEEPETPGSLAALQQTAFTHAEFAGGLLWLLDDAGRVTTVDLARGLREQVRLPGRALLMCRTGQAPLVVTGGARWTLWRREGAGWTRLAAAAPRHDAPVALSCADGRVRLLTTARLLELEGATFRATALSERLRSGVVATMPASGPALFLGVDAGEWGGGLRRIDPDGTVSVIARSHGLCGGPLNTACDPVNGLAALPGRPGCLVAAIGLNHMMAHGRLTRMCGKSIERLYFKPYTIETRWPANADEDAFPGTVPFYGLAALADGSVLAAGGDGLYRIAADGAVRFQPMPPFRDVGGIAVSDAVRGIVLVRTSINGRVALSGATPMMVTR